MSTSDGGWPLGVITGVTAGTETAVARPCRVRRMTVRAAASPGAVVIRDGGAGGTVRLTIQPLASQSSLYEVNLNCETDFHLTLGANISDVYWEVE